MPIYQNEDTNKKLYQVEYASFMIFSSYFKKCEVRTNVLEKRLYLYYQEMSPKVQGDYEEAIIDMLDLHILPLIPMKDLETLDSECRIIATKKDNHIFEFKTNKGVFSFEVSLEGQKANYTVHVNGKKFNFFTFIKKKDVNNVQTTQKIADTLDSLDDLEVI